jgi:hypothetical protein
MRVKVIGSGLEFYENQTAVANLVIPKFGKAPAYCSHHLNKTT